MTQCRPPFDLIPTCKPESVLLWTPVRIWQSSFSWKDPVTVDGFGLIPSGCLLIRWENRTVSGLVPGFQVWKWPGTLSQVWDQTQMTQIYSNPLKFFTSPCPEYPVLVSFRISPSFTRNIFRGKWLVEGVNDWNTSCTSRRHGWGILRVVTKFKLVPGIN